MSYTSKCGVCGHLVNVHVAPSNGEPFVCQFCDCVMDRDHVWDIPLNQQVAERDHPEELAWIRRRWP